MAKLEPVDVSKIQTRLLIGGEWVDGAAGAEIDVVNPYNGQKICAIAEAREEALDRMIADAEALGANAVVSMRYATSDIASGAAEILTYGTAVVVEDPTAL